MADVKPTRSELLNFKKKIKLAKNGHSLLKKKRDGLIMEFFEILKQAKSLRAEMLNDYKDAVSKLNIARTVESELYLKSLALAVTNVPVIRAETKNIMGIKVPKIRKESEIRKNISDRGFGILTGSYAIDDAAKQFEKVIEKAIIVSEIEISMKKILNEIEKTKRRVNALEFAIIPRMQTTTNFISLRLEEMERENIISLKHIKSKKQ
ncbi:MAG: V-type ATP synthase subunit D [Candidatus Woesearchaeota archaeon]